MSVSEPIPGLYRLEEPDGSRRLCQAVVEASERILVVDAGLPESPERSIVPLLRRLGADTRPVVVVLTHPDADHRGGAAALRDALPEVEIWGHELDAEQLADPEVVLAERYQAFAATDHVGPDAAGLERMRARLGPPVRLDRRLTGDTVLELGGGRTVELLHTPGHSPGSITAWLPDQRAAVIGDAVVGVGTPTVDGSLLYPPMFTPPSAYFGTIDRLESLRPRLVVSGHDPVLEDRAVPEFLATSREAALRLRALVRDAVGDSTLAQLCAAVAERYEPLPNPASLAMTVDGFLGELADGGEVAVDGGPPRRFRRIG